MASTTRDFDRHQTYTSSLARLFQPDTKNFILKFGAEHAFIDFNINSDDSAILHPFQSVQDTTDSEGMIGKSNEIRWIQIWAPHLHTALIQTLAQEYGFSARLRDIMCSTPESMQSNNKEKADFARNETDLERAHVSKKREPLEKETRARGNDGFDHYSIVKCLSNYQSVDVGERFLCVGANWMCCMPEEEETMRIWSWLVVCDDGTVLSLTESPDVSNSTALPMKAIRAHTYRILSQLSLAVKAPREAIEMISIRQGLIQLQSQNVPVQEIAREGSSNLFYYLFDNWNTSYKLLLGFQNQISAISLKMLSPPSQDPQDSLVTIQQLYNINLSLRREEHLHRGYSNLVKRILEHGSTSSPRIQAFLVHPPESNPFTEKSMGVILSFSALMRFQHLSDRIDLLILATLEKLTLERDSLLSTHFNLTAQRDSHNNTTLSQNAALLSKLGVLFLPVSLMTAYFSIQVQEIDSYTLADYWGAFGVVLGLSLLALFFASRWLLGFWWSARNILGICKQ